jgi:hypothetical protein
MMHLLKEGDAFTCSAIKGLTCSTKEDKWDNDQWEVDGKVQIGVDSTKEDWVMCEQCSKWRKVPVGTCFDLDEAFVCSMLEGCNCDVKEEGWVESGQRVRSPRFESSSCWASWLDSMWRKVG